ncbi:YheC/YheD family protein [Bacillus salitolerans]|uniref:YheC/YheD family protein n=1 Tax=Bacillus salitolerans TaxID=1437434 RepID=A0ABW4LJV7_9BACI
MLYKIVPNNLVSTVKIPAELKEELKNSKEVAIKYGLQTQKIEVIAESSLSKDRLSLSTNTIHELSLPLEGLYELKVNGEEIIIGPYIGILAALTSDSLEKLLPSLSTYVNKYERIGGSIMAFALDGVDQENHCIQGYLYNPSNAMWNKGIYKYPNSLFSIVEASLTDKWKAYQSIMYHFRSYLGNRVFNFPNFSKWEMNKMLTKEFHSYLPETVVYKDADDILNMLDKHGNIFIKPVNGRLGKLVYKAVLTKSGAIIHYGKNGNQKERQFHTKKHFRYFFQSRLSGGEYIIQKSIDLITYHHRVMDLRVIMVKDQNKRWRLLGMLTRFGANGSIVSNITAGGRAEMASKTFRKRLGLPRDIQKRLYRQIKDITFHSIKEVEAHGYHCGNIGFDIGIDQNLKPWIIEINNQNPDHYIALAAGSRSLFYRARMMNMLYAKSLAGF